MFARSTALSQRSLHAALAAAGFCGLILLILLGAGSRPVSQAAEPPGTVGPPAAKPGAGDEAPPIFVDKIPDGYRDWKLISVAHEEGDLHSFAAVLGNDVAIKAYRERKLPFPDGTIIAALHWRHAPSEENNKVFGRAQSFVAGSPTNVSLWSRTQRNTPPRTAGGSVISTSAPATNLATRRCSIPACPATRRPKTTLSSPAMRLEVLGHDLTAERPSTTYLKENRFMTPSA